MYTRNTSPTITHQGRTTVRVALGTIEVSDEARKAIRKINGGKGDATRGEVKDYILSHIDDDVLPAAIQRVNDGGDADDALEEVREEQAANHVEGAPHGNAPDPVSAEQLPEVPGAGTTGDYTGTTTTTTGGDGTTPSTGDLGQAGTPGGTV